MIPWIGRSGRVVLAGVWLAALVPVLQAQPFDEDVQYAFGAVVKASAERLTVLEYDYDKDQEVEISYAVSPETKLIRLTALAELTSEDVVDVYYKETGGQRAAVMIAKEEPLEEESEAENEDGPPVDEGTVSE
ncbi:MAG: hypothetical protein Q8Q08_02235 [Candidatus Omnitrophota bacterium]|nr:hypothetical protein [Candidatus Omnitrophota bacterium]MDZ4241847.1 hypothetical protein [Candidatus Omnitrophota bacterium]